VVLSASFLKGDIQSCNAEGRVVCEGYFPAPIMWRLSPGFVYEACGVRVMALSTYERHSLLVMFVVVVPKCARSRLMVPGNVASRRMRVFYKSPREGGTTDRGRLVCGKEMVVSLRR
jgi:hypothetical protein